MGLEFRCPTVRLDYILLTQKRAFAQLLILAYKIVHFNMLKLTKALLMLLTLVHLINKAIYFGFLEQSHFCYVCWR